LTKARQQAKGATSSVTQQKTPAAPKAQAAPIPSALLQLQRAYGNQATTRYLQRKAIQRAGGPEEEELQLKADPAQRAGGPEEEELQLKADPAQRAAGPEEEELQLKSDPAQRVAGPEEEELQLKTDAAQRAGGPEEEELQLKSDPAQLAGGPEEEELQMKPSPAAAPVQRSTGGNKMPEDVQTKMENAFQADFSDVNIHVGSQASDVGALAYAQGNDIHFAQGKFDPQTQSGQELLGHELAHVVQQRQGRVQPNTEVAGLPVNDDPALEREADQLGRAAAQTKLEDH
jgi:hypothetical protein